MCDCVNMKDIMAVHGKQPLAISLVDKLNN